MGSSRAVASAVLGATLAALPGPLVAQPKGSDPSLAQAKDLVNKAIAKSQAGDHATAIDLYLQAYNIAPLPLLLSNLGSEYQQAGKPVEALKYFCQYLEAEPTGPNASYATAQAKVLQTQLHNPVEDGNVCKPAGAPPPAVGSGSDAGSAAGSDAGSAILTAPPPATPGRGLTYAGIGIGAAGVALGVLGVVYGIKASNISSDISNHPISQPWPDNIHALEAEGQSDQSYQIAFLVAGGVAVAGGVVLYALGRRAHTTERLTLVPVAGARTGGLALVGAW